jgi:anti-anti-sigma factor
MAAAEQGQSSGVSWTIDRQHGLITIHVSGELDLSSADAVERLLEEAIAACPVTVIDLDGLDFMDSTGLRVLASAHRAAGTAGARFLLGRPSAAVLRVLSVSGLVEHFDYVEGAPPAERVCPVCDEQVTATDVMCVHCGGSL